MDERTTDPPADASAPRPPVPRTGENGEPVYDQEFFLALARCGKEVWNEWRESHPNIPVTFENVDFQEAGVSFSDFRFGDDANFAGAIFGYGHANFSGAIFGDRAKFCRAGFASAAMFFGARFGKSADFSDASFGVDAFFTNVIFGSKAQFCRTSFGLMARFFDSTFGDRADFSDAVIGPTAGFHRVDFGEGASFHGTTFGDSANFSDVRFRGDADFRAGSIKDSGKLRPRLPKIPGPSKTGPNESKDSFAQPEEGRSGSDTFRRIQFSNALFEGFADFSGRKFEERCDLTGVRFRRPPSFDAGDRLDRLDLYGATIGFAGRLKSPKLPPGVPRPQAMREVEWTTDSGVANWRRQLRDLADRFFPLVGWTTDSDVANQLRRLRDLADITKNHDLERDLYIEERKAERGIFFAQYWREGWSSLRKPGFYSHCLWIVVMAVFSLLADYGRSFTRPLIALAMSVPLFWLAYSAVLTPPRKDNTPEANRRTDRFDRGVWAFAISNAVPFVGPLTLERDVKLTLLCGDRPIDKEQAKPGESVCVPIPGRRFQLLALAQSIFSALCIFFAGLALRNYFKLH